MKRKKGERRQDFLSRAHDAEGLRRFGVKAWNQANIGWGATATSICSKVYGAKLLGDKNTQVQSFQTDLTTDGNGVTHTLHFV